MNDGMSRAELRWRRVLAPILGVGLLLAATACTSTDTDRTRVSASDSAVASIDAGSLSDAPISDGVTPAPTEYGASTSETPEVSLPPAVTTPVPAPGGGDINQTVAASEMSTQAPVALDQPGDFGQGVTVALDKVESITTEAQLPGEIAGPGLAMTVTMTNDSGAAIGLSTVVVDVSDGAGAPAISMTAAPAAPFSGELAAGQQATGVYVVTLPAGHTDPLTISVTYSSQSPVVVFTGATP